MSNDQDIVKRLRGLGERFYPFQMCEAADEIERLRNSYPAMKAALERLHLAVIALGKVGKNNVTLFEDSPTKSQEAFEAWNELNAAQSAARAALGLQGE